MHLLYHKASIFSIDSAVSKTQETATPVDSSETQGDIFVPFGLGMLGERLCLSKARSNFGGIGKRDNFYKIAARPRGADL